MHLSCYCVDAFTLAEIDQNRTNYVERKIVCSLTGMKGRKGKKGVKSRENRAKKSKDTTTEGEQLNLCPRHAKLTHTKTQGRELVPHAALAHNT